MAIEKKSLLSSGSKQNPKSAKGVTGKVKAGNVTPAKKAIASKRATAKLATAKLTSAKLASAKATPDGMRFGK